ncbi:ABC transporter permease [Eisenbergiella porci]|uniref:ABC transporter permease n=1 Tax=Eisenbergiella porci TaxID=2652274 RepID=UPI002A7F0721|nr:ABC transporter permease [Eisenbergiella porci]
MNDVLFGNNNNYVIKKLAKADLNAHKLKTFLSGTIILIATCLMAVVFMVLINDAFSLANETPYHAMYRAVPPELKETLLNDSDFEAVGIYKNIGSTVDTNGVTTLAYMDPVSMDLLGFELLNGNAPVKPEEAAISSACVAQYGLSIGDPFTFSYTNALTNQQEQRQFTICGITQNKKQEEANQFYVLVSNEFRMAFARQTSGTAISSFSTQTPASVDVLLKLNARKAGMGADAQKEYLKDKGISLGIKNYDILLNERYIEGFFIDPTMLAGILLFALFLMFASSFVIYSIFYISVINSIQMYAQMMSLGTTEKQLYSFLKRQGNILSLYFIPPGMVISLAIALLISGTEWIIYDIPITLLSGLLIFIVIKIALRKPAEILASVSPVEAMKHTDTGTGERHKPLKIITPGTLAQNNLYVNRKKNRMAVISLSISGTLMIAFTILITSFNLEAVLLEDYPVGEEFQIGVQLDNFYERFPQIIQNNPLSDELVNEILSIAGVEKIIKDEAVIGRLLEPKVTADPENVTELIESLSPELLANVSKTVSGSIDYNDIGTDGIIINKFRVDRSTLAYDKIQTGDTIRFQFDVNGEISEKVFRVIGIAYFPSTGLFYSSPEVINTISPFNNTSHLSVLCDGNSTEEIKVQLQSLIRRNPSLTLHIYSDEYGIIKDFIGVAMNSLNGISAFVIVFGLLNMINMLINSALIRRREFALLQAVGMTNGQLRKMLYREGASISVKAVIIATVMGIICGRLFCYLANEVMAFKFIIFRVSILPILIFAVLLIGLQMFVTFCICKSIERDTLTDRLRTE